MAKPKVLTDEVFYKINRREISPAKLSFFNTAALFTKNAKGSFCSFCMFGKTKTARIVQNFKNGGI